ncbi:MAG: hypothetical protein ACREQ7_17805 [Candidatus Binatia bacterium]
MARRNEDSARDYSKDLRAIGCALEALRVEAFELRCEAANYVVRVESQRGEKRKLKDIFEALALQVLQGIFPGRNPRKGLELIYTTEHIKRLNENGQLRRQDRGKPDAHSLPQALRAIGAYVELKGARLLKISRQGTVITIRYETALDGCTNEEFTPSSVYALFVRRYVKRTDRYPTSAGVEDTGNGH